MHTKSNGKEEKLGPTGSLAVQQLDAGRCGQSSTRLDEEDERAERR